MADTVSETSMSVVYAQMEDSLDKLKCLNYEDDYLGNSRQPITRTHFAVAGENVSIQFQEFLDLTSYLVAKVKKDSEFFKIDKYDDPNTAVNKMLLALRSLDYTGDFPANKLKAANGEAVTHVLDFLTDKALESSGFVWKTPKHSDANEPEEDVDGEDSDIDDIEDEIEVAEEERPMFEVAAEDVMDLDNENHQIIDSNVDPIEWKTELERVGPRLRTGGSALGKEWRSHIDQTKKHEILIRNELPATESTLKQINSQLTADVEKMRTKEKYVNTTFSSLAEEYTRVKETLVGVESEHSTASGAVGNLTQDLAVIADQLSEIKGTMDSRGSSMTDTTPLVKIRTALQDIKVEINHFELRIGVVGHTLLAAQTRGSKEGEEGEAGVVGEDGDSDDGGEFE